MQLGKRPPTVPVLLLQLNDARPETEFLLAIIREVGISSAMKALFATLALTFGLLCASGSAKAKKDDAPDPKKFEEYKAKAVKGDAEAQTRLGVCYATGIGVEKDAAEAVRWFRKAAEQGIAQAQYNFGICYHNGTGVEKDEKEAFAWVNIAAVKMPETAKIRDDMEKRLSPEVISAGQKRSKELREQFDARMKNGN